VFPFLLNTINIIQRYRIEFIQFGRVKRREVRFASLLPCHICQTNFPIAPSKLRFQERKKETNGEHHQRLQKMRFRFNPYRLLFPSNSLLPQVEQVDDDLPSAPISSPPEVKEGLTLSTITIPTTPRHESLHLPPARTFDTIGKDIDVSCVATTSNDSEIVRVVLGSGDGKVFFIKPAITTTENDDADSNDADSSRSLVPFQGPESEVSSIVFSPDNTKLLVSWNDGKVMAFDAKDGSILEECQAPGGLRDCAFSKDGKRVVIGGNDGWKMFDFNNFPDEIKSDELNSPPGGGRVNSVTFSDEDTKLAVGVVNGDAPGCYIYNAKGNNKLLNTFRKEGEGVMKVAFSPNKMLLAVGSFGKVHLFNVATGDCLHTRWWQGYTKVNGVRTTR
jgi:WD40 repeat protein